MLTKKVILPFLAGIITLLALPLSAFADSPLTSTDFYPAYMDVEIVKQTRENHMVDHTKMDYPHANENQIIDEAVANYLHASENPIDVKAAVINALGWDVNKSLGWDESAKMNSEEYVHLIYGTDIEHLQTDSLSADELFCISYLMALDHYFDVDKAIELMEEALSKDKTNFTIALILSVEKDQTLLDKQDHWSDIWTNTDRVLQDASLVKNMRPEAVNHIAGYLKSYKDFRPDPPLAQPEPSIFTRACNYINHLFS